MTMQLISGPVGHGCDNKNHSDVALVQAILVLTEQPTTSPQCGKPYLAHYNGTYSNHTYEALRAFQKDHVFVAPDGKQPAGDAPATPGRVAPDDGTWRKLVEKVSPEFSYLRVLSGGRTVYVSASLDDLNRNLLAAYKMTFAPTFRSKVINCFFRMLMHYGIAIGVCDNGDRRDFQTQYELLTKPLKPGEAKVTNAGPGESNHNFGQAVDLGFQGLRWLRSDGTVVENETFWLHRLNPDQKVLGREALLFYETLRNVGTQECGLFRGPLHDRPHLQAWSDKGVDMASRLADLLTRSGTMQWSGKHQHYKCDLGLGGELFKVGTAAQIWTRSATVTIHTLTPKHAAVKHAATRKGVAHTAASATEHKKVTAADVKTMQNELRRQFELADANWEKWTAQ
jgi:hypothetical protein